jgi:hypothetical protein
MDNLYRRFRQRFRWLQSRVGRRGTMLSLYSVFFFGVGQAYLTGNLRQSAVIQFLNMLMPPQYWGVMYLVAGVLCTAGMFRRKCQPLSFGISTFLMSLWSVISFISWVLTLINPHNESTPNAWLGGMIYGLLAAIAVMVAGWKENDGT